MDCSMATTRVLVQYAFDGATAYDEEATPPHTIPSDKFQECNDYIVSVKIVFSDIDDVVSHASDPISPNQPCECNIM